MSGIGGAPLAEAAVRIAFALAAGGIVGVERSYHGRPAGFRTHALVSMASSALMLVAVYESAWFGTVAGSARPVIDPTRIAQGIMTGIGFLGAGVIMKQGLAVRGLTTAASIWVTACIGILIGVGLYGPAALTTALTLAALAGFRWLERRMKTEIYVRLSVRFDPAHPVSQSDFRTFVVGHGFAPAGVSQHFRRSTGTEYHTVIHTPEPGALARLSDALRQREGVAEFHISRGGD